MLSLSLSLSLELGEEMSAVCGDECGGGSEEVCLPKADIDTVAGTDADSRIVDGLNSVPVWEGKWCKRQRPTTVRQNCVRTDISTSRARASGGLAMPNITNTEKLVITETTMKRASTLLKWQGQIAVWTASAT